MKWSIPSYVLLRIGMVAVCLGAVLIAIGLSNHIAVVFKAGVVMAGGAIADFIIVGIWT